MESRASTFFKQLFSAVVAMVKAKTLAVRSKARVFKLRLLIFRLLRSKKLLLKSINHKMHALLMSQDAGEECGSSHKEQHSGAIVLYGAARDEALATPTETESNAYAAADDDADGYPDLTHSLFDFEDDDELVNATGSVIDLVKNAREDGAEFRLEDEIDHVADVFIRRFHRQMWLQKQESFKRYQEMMERSV